MKKTWPIILGSLVLAAPAAVQAQFVISTNADNTIAITQYTGTGGAVAIPPTTNGLTVTIIGHGAFSDVFGNSGGSLITEVMIPSGVTSVEANAFEVCTDLTNVTILGSLTNIGDFAFFRCVDLEGVTIPGSVSSIGYNAFGECNNLTNVIIVNGVGSIGDEAFADSGLTSVTIPGSVTNIGLDAFDACTNLASVTIGNGVPEIGVQAFFSCTSLTSVTIPGSLTNIGELAFGYCTNLTRVTIPGGVTSIGDGAFEQSGLTSVTIPGSVTSIGGSAFLMCQSLTSVTVLGSVTSIGDYAFNNSTNLRSVYFTGDAPTLGSNVFSPDNDAAVYYLPGTTGWSSPFGGLSPVLWNPVIQTGDGGFGMRNNQFGFDITASNDFAVVVEVCTNLANADWVPLTTNTLVNGLFHYSEPLQGNSSGRFYGLGFP